VSATTPTPQLPLYVHVGKIGGNMRSHCASLSTFRNGRAVQHGLAFANEVTAPRGLHSSYELNHRHHHHQNRLPFMTTTAMMMSTADNHDDDLLPTTSSTTYDCYDEDEEDHTENDIDNGNEDIDSITHSQSSILLHALTSAVQSALETLSRKTASLERELSKARTLEDTMKRANLIVSNLYRLPPGTDSVEVEDWENGGELITLTLNTKDYNSAQEESDTLFALARKMKRGSKIVEELMQQSLEGEQILQKAMLGLESISTIADEGDDGTLMDEEKLMLIQDTLQRTSSKTGFKSPAVTESTTAQSSRSRAFNKSNARESNNKPNPRVLKSPSGHQVLVGRNRRDNEAICFQLSKPTDIWMHARGCPGAHVLLCVRRGSPEVKEEDMQFAANLAAFYSNARTETKAAITTAEPKHITKPRGAPMGAVSLRQEGKTIIGRPGDVSDDLKEAREKSGAAWDELGYRTLGTRMKNTKKTAAVEKARRDKSREEAMSKSKRRKRKEVVESWY
jgi:predicted ribosome quality control (RQC) complex YloA/Tae2 family protein